MAEQQADILRKIHETEHKAEQALRKAQVEAQSMREQARAKAEEIIKARENELADRRRMKRERELEAIEKEAQALLSEAREQAERMTRLRRLEIDHVADRLLEQLLHSGVLRIR